MNTKLLKMARRNMRIIARDFDVELQFKDSDHWEYMYDGSLSEALRVMHNHMRRNIKPFYIHTNGPKIIC